MARRLRRCSSARCVQVDARLAAGKSVPGLAVVLIGENAASEVYVRNKRKTTDQVSMRSFAYDLPATASEAEVLALVDTLNGDPAVNGILDSSCRCRSRSIPSA